MPQNQWCKTLVMVRETETQHEYTYIYIYIYIYDSAAKLLRIGKAPISFTSNTRNAVDPGVLINLEAGPTHGPFTVYPWHCFHLVHWMLKAHQSSSPTVEHTPCTHHHTCEDHAIFSHDIMMVYITIYIFIRLK